MVLLSPVADEQLDLAVDFERPVSLYLPDRNGCPLSTMGTSMELRLESESNDLYSLMLGLGAERNVPGVDGAFNGSNSRSSCFGSVGISACSFAWPCNELLDMLAIPIRRGVVKELILVLVLPLLSQLFALLGFPPITGCLSSTTTTTTTTTTAAARAPSPRRMSYNHSRCASASDASRYATPFPTQPRGPRLKAQKAARAVDTPSVDTLSSVGIQRFGQNANGSGK